MAEILIFDVLFTDRARLQEAFALLLDENGVESCTVESDTLSARFTATESAGSAIAERIYAIGGLRWCTRHLLRSPS